MRKRIGSKIYDTDAAELLETRTDGIQIYRKTGGLREVFLYNPRGQNKYEMFSDLPEDEAEKYTGPVDLSESINGTHKTVQFFPADLAKIKRLASQKQMSKRAFIMMLVDEYESRTL